MFSHFCNTAHYLMNNTPIWVQMLIRVMVSLWTAKNITSWHLPFLGSDTLQNSRNCQQLWATSHPADPHRTAADSFRLLIFTEGHDWSTCINTYISKKPGELSAIIISYNCCERCNWISDWQSTKLITMVC